VAHNERAGRGQPRQLSGVKRTSQFDRCALIIREYFPPKEAGTRIGIILMASLFGMAMGGWMSGYIFDLTGSYRAAFFNGLGWNAVNGAIVLWILFRRHSRIAYA
jgi:MFS family permease